MKLCRTCGTEKPLDQYRRNAGTKDGRQTQCKPCANARLDLWRARTRERRLAYNRAYYASAKGRRVILDYQARKPGKKFAQTQVNLAVQRGELVRPTCCEACNRERRVEGHHDDYAKPLTVRWLCRDCHKAWHRKHGEASNADTPPKWSGVRAAHIAAKKARLPLVIAMHKAGKAQKEIAAHFGIHPTAVHADLRDVGLTRQYTRG